MISKLARRTIWLS